MPENSSSGDDTAAGINMIGSCLVVSMKGDLDVDVTLQIQKDILCSVKKNRAKEVLIDISLIRILDLPVFKILKETAQMIMFLGSDVVFAGFQAGVASALVDLDADLSGIRTAVTIDDGFKLFGGE